MRGAVLEPPTEVRVEDRPQPPILKPTDAAVPLAATCATKVPLQP